MAISTHYTDEQNKIIAERIGKQFGLPDAGMKMLRDGWRLEGYGKEARLTVELFKFISIEEAEAILNAKPLEGASDGRQ